jgi:hypothetical protein
MPSGYTTISASVVVDLDDIFASLSPSTTPANPVNFKSGGSDLSNRFEPITTGGQQIQFNVNYSKNNTDLRYIFANKNFTPTPTVTPTITVTPEVTPTRTPAVTPTPPRSYYY